MLTLRGTAFFKPASIVQSGTRSLSSSFSSADDEPIGASSKHRARENRQRVAEGALHNATPALKGVADVYTKKGRAVEGSYFVKEDREALHKLVKKWRTEDAAASGKSGQ